MLLLDAGGMFPKNDMYGINLVLLDYTRYLADKKDWGRGIIVTHSHEDHRETPLFTRLASSPAMKLSMKPDLGQ